VRVTFLAPNYLPSVGGAQIHVQRVAEGLAARHGHDVAVLTTDAIGAPASAGAGRVDRGRERIGGVDVQRVPVARRTHAGLRLARRAARNLGHPPPASPRPLEVGPLGARLAVAACLAGRRSDVLVGVASPFLSLLGADRGRTGAPSAYVAMPLIHLTGAPVPRWVVRSLRRADGCTTSTAVERSWVVSQGVDAARVAVLPPGCEPAAFADLEPAAARRELGLPDRPTIGVVGRIAAHKGLDTLMAAAPEIWSGHPDLTILVAGARTSWGGLDDLVRPAAELGGDRLVVRPAFDEAERGLVFAACDVVVFPSREESFGMVTLEAWCARRPVVATDIAAVRCLVRPGEDSDLVAVDDPGGLARAVGALLDDPERRERYGRAGRLRAEHEFGWDAIVDGWDELLGASVERRRSGGSHRGAPTTARAHP
jgi:glycosyltransferase involved in cell wall biosynthesis